MFSFYFRLQFIILMNKLYAVYIFHTLSAGFLSSCCILCPTLVYDRVKTTNLLLRLSYFALISSYYNSHHQCHWVCMVGCVLEEIHSSHICVQTLNNFALRYRVHEFHIKFTRRINQCYQPCQGKKLLFNMHPSSMRSFYSMHLIWKTI